MQQTQQTKTTSNKSIQHYQGNINLKRAGVSMSFTQEQADEIAKCAADVHYFISKYFKIVTLDDGLVNFEPYDYQTKIIDNIEHNRFNIIMQARQSGKSTVLTAYITWYIMFHDFVNVALLSDKAEGARDLLNRIQIAYESLPWWLQTGVKEWNKGSVILENESSVVARSTSPKSIRGQRYNLVLLDEFAHVDNNMAEDFTRSVIPTLSSGKDSKIVVISTPKGLNKFYKMWTEAESGTSPFVPHRVDWWQVPGRDQAWKDNEIQLLGSIEAFNQEHGLEFQGSSDTLISAATLRAMAVTTPINVISDVKIYEEPKEDHSYFITVDTSESIGKDYCTISVLDITAMPYKLVASYKNNTMPILTFPNVIMNIAQYFNDAYVLIENASTGFQVATSLHEDLEYENLMFCSSSGSSGQVLGGGAGKMTFGVKMSSQVRSIGCSNLKDLLENNKLVINDHDTIFELSNFILKGKKFQADVGFNDDLVMSLVLFAWAAKQDYFKELTGTDIRTSIYEARVEKAQEDILPFGVIHDGRDEENSYTFNFEEEPDYGELLQNFEDVNSSLILYD